MKTSIIVAASENGVIGNDEKIPWHIPDDLKRFKLITSGHHILMGRKTHDSIGRILPNRTNIILSRQTNLKIEGAVVFQDFGEAVKFASDRKENELFVIGGKQIYEIALPLAEKIYQTLVLGNYEGNITFPEINKSEWVETSQEKHLETEPKYIYRNLERR